MQRSRTEGSTGRLRSNSNLTLASEEEEIVHPVEPRARTPMLPPVMVRSLPSNVSLVGKMLTVLCVEQAKAVDDHPLCWLGFEEDCIITSCSTGESIFSSLLKICYLVLLEWSMLREWWWWHKAKAVQSAVTVADKTGLQATSGHGTGRKKGLGATMGRLRRRPRPRVCRRGIEIGVDCVGLALDWGRRVGLSMVEG
jgi:hypothetical protein